MTVLAIAAVVSLSSGVGAQPSFAYLHGCDTSDGDGCGGGGGGTAYASVSNSSSQAPAKVGTAFSFQYQATPAGSSVDFSGGSLPPGLTMSSSGAITGTPTASGTFYFNFTVTPPSGSPYSGSGGMADSITVAAATAPTAPQNVSTSIASATAITVRWDAPTSFGGAPLDHYFVTASDGKTASVTGTSATIDGLTAGSSYSFTVQAVTAAGSGASATSASTVPAAVPDAPTITSVVPGDSQAVVNWSAPAVNGSAITSYDLQSMPTSGGWSSPTRVAGSATSAVLSGLTNGAAYSFRVSANNGIGASAPSVASSAVTPKGVPGAPTVSLAPGDRSISVNWAEPPANGDPVTAYTVTLSLNGTTVETRTVPTPIPSTFSGLTNGTTYAVTVGATNSVGTTTSRAQTTAPFGVPGAVARLSASAGDASSTLSWTAADPNGAAVTYRVSWSADGGATWKTVGSTTATTITAPGLTNGTAYTFRVVASNGAGSGASASTTVTPYGVPSAPTSLQVAAGDTTALATWSAPTSDGGRPVSSYSVQTSTDGTTWTTVGSTSSMQYRIDGLTNGQATSVRVFATNLRGAGATSAVQTTSTSGRPTAPTITAAVAGSGAVQLSWNAGSSNGAALTGYTVEVSVDGSTWTAATTTSTPAPTALSTTATGLVNAQAYRFRIAATNANGSSTPSNTVAATPFTVPDAPAAPEVSPGDGSATVTWTAPDFDGGRPVTAYTVWRDSGSGIEQVATVTDGSDTVYDTRLANGTTYTYRVAAVNDAGASALSASTSTTPRTVPGSPTGLSATAHDGAVQLHWTAPTRDGGQTVSTYELWESLDHGATWVRVDTTSGTSSTVDGRQNGTTYWYQVLAGNDAGFGTPSNTVSATPRTVPGAPEDVRATAGDATVTLDWSAPTDDGGAPVSEYVVEQLGTDGGWDVVQTTTATTTVISSLTNGTLVTFRVLATNEAGTGEDSFWAVATPRTVPGTPSGLRSTPGDRSVSLTWSAPAWNGGAAIATYRLEQATGDGDWVRFGEASGTSTTVRGLANGTPVRFRVSATNEAGTGTPSDTVTTTPRTIADAPTGLTVTPADQQADLAWTAPEGDGGSAVTGYLVQTSADRGATWTDVGPASDTALSVNGLTNGTPVSFRVLAVTAAGQGTPSAPVTVTPRRSPGEPRSLATVAGDRSVTLTWTAPVSDGGAPLDGYLVQVALSDGTWGASRPVDGTTTTIDGLANGTEYGFRVAAVNAAGTGAWSVVATTTPFVFAPSFTDTTGASVVGKTLTVGDTVVFAADHLPVGAFVSLELHSTVRVLASGTVGDDGTIRLTATIPTDIEAGSHHLVAAIDGVDATIAPVEVAIRLAAAPVPAVGTPTGTVSTGSTTGTSRVGDPATGTPHGALAFTGSRGNAPVVVGGLTVLLAGLVLTLRGAVRRRRRD